MRNIILLGSFVILTLAGCTSLKDARGPSEICEVHHTYMRSLNVPGPKGQLAVTMEYVEATKKLFPHTYLDYAPDDRHHWVIYVCDDCVRAKAAWERQHPESVPALKGRGVTWEGIEQEPAGNGEGMSVVPIEPRSMR